MALPATDTFTTGSDQSLTSYSANWTMSISTMQVLAATDDVYGGNSGSPAPSSAFWNADTFNADHYSQITVSSINTTSSWIGVCCRATASGNLYSFEFNGSSAESNEYNSSVYTNKASTTSSFVASDTARTEASSTSIVCKRNGSTISALSFTDSTHTGGSAGISCYYNSSDSRLDNFEGGNLAAAITYFGVASNPADNANPNTQNNGVYVVTPPASMQAGDLCVMVTQARTTNEALQVMIPAGGDGQTWTSETVQSGTTISTQLHWCTFNGTWTSNPAGYIRPQGRGGMMSGCGQSLGDTTAPFTTILVVFRPTSTSKTWAIDVAKASTTFAAPSTPFTVTRTGITTVANNVVALAVWGSGDDNTWGTLSGAGWNQVGTQWRNLASSDMSTAIAYQIVATGGTATGNVSLNQATLGGDAGNTTIIGLKEV